MLLETVCLNTQLLRFSYYNCVVYISRLLIGIKYSSMNWFVDFQGFTRGYLDLLQANELIIEDAIKIWMLEPVHA